MKKYSLIFFCLLSFSPLTLAQQPSIMTGDLALNQLPATMLDNKTIQTRVTEDNLDALYQRFERHFGDFLGESPKRQVDYDFIMGQASSLETFNLLYLYYLGVSEQLDMSAFERFGLKVTGVGEVDYDFGIYKFLASPASLFIHLRSEVGVRVVAYGLVPKGFRPIDMDIFNQHISNSQRQLSVTTQTTAYNEQVLPRLKKLIDNKHLIDPIRYEHELKVVDYAKHYVLFRVNQMWGRQLMAKFDAKRQAILKPFLVSKISGARGSSNILSLKTDHFRLEEQIVSGRFELFIQSSKDIIAQGGFDEILQ